VLEARLNDPVTSRMHQDFTQLSVDLTVGEALEQVRREPPPGRVIYFYVVDAAGQLVGVVPTRRLLLSPPSRPIAEIMVRNLVTVPGSATVLDACQFFILHRLLAFPVVDDQRHILGVVDIDLYTEALAQVEKGTPVARLVAPLARFLRIEAAGGLVLLACTAVALLLANSPLAGALDAFWETHAALTVGDFRLEKSLLHWVNDGLMTLFFFVVGLEIKRELIHGELADLRKALLPVLMAVGGMVVPALVYLLVAGRAGARGWAVPVATDIAFVVGVLALLGPRVPYGLKVLLLTLAIADDIGGVMVIACFYTEQISLPALGVAFGGLVLVVIMQRLGFRRVWSYLVIGAGVWFAFVASGVHPTIAGVILGLLTPSRGLRRRVPIDVVHDLYGRLLGAEGEMAPALSEPVSPLDRLEHALHPWAAFAVMPVFALANAGVALHAAEFGWVALASALGLMVGKPVGLFVFARLAVALGFGRLPEGVSWPVLAAAGCLGGIGFTMSLFIAGLAFSGPMLGQAKSGTLLASVVSGVLGAGLLLATLKGGRMK
jgi:Na+:H+ antiporter, NhaA family